MSKDQLMRLLLLQQLTPSLMLLLMLPMIRLLLPQFRWRDGGLSCGAGQLISDDSRSLFDRLPVCLNIPLCLCASVAMCVSMSLCVLCLRLYLWLIGCSSSFTQLFSLSASPCLSSVRPPVCLCACWYVRLCLYLFCFRPSASPSVHLYGSVCLFVCLSICMSVSVCLSACVSVCLSVCPNVDD